MMVVAGFLRRNASLYATNSRHASAFAAAARLPHAELRLARTTEVKQSSLATLRLRGTSSKDDKPPPPSTTFAASMPSRSTGAVDSAGSPGGWRRGTRGCRLPHRAAYRLPSRLRRHGAPRRRRVGADGSVAPLRYAAGASRNREIRTNCAPQVWPCTRRANRLPLGPRRNRQESAPHRQAGPFRQPATSGPDRGRTGCARSASATRQLVLTTGTGELGRPRGHQTKGIAWLRLLSLAPRQAPDLVVRQEDKENPPQAKGGPSRGTG